SCHFPKSASANCQSGLQRAAYPGDIGRERRFFTTNLQRTAVDCGKLQDSAAHFDQDCRGLWQGKPLYFNGNRCSRLWKMTPPDLRQGTKVTSGSENRQRSKAMPSVTRTPSRRATGTASARPH